METELQSKHNEKKKIKNELRSVNITLKSSLSVIFYNCLIHQINIASKSKLKAITKRHLRKLDKFRRKTSTPINEKVTFSHIRNTVHNFSNYSLSNEEYKALSFGLDYHIPNQPSYHTTETELEMFYQNILPNLSHILDNQLTELKSKLRNACHKYNNIKVPYKYQNIDKDLANNKDIRILRQDKGRGIVIMDSSKYIEKCLSIFDNEKFIKITDDPTKRIECKIQRCVRKIKNKISKTEYLQLYPTGSSPGKFHGTAKIHKLPNGGNITELPLRHIVSNIGTASYYLSKYLAKLLSPLSQTEYAVKNIK